MYMYIERERGRYMCVYIYIHTKVQYTADLRTKILDFRGSDSGIINFQGWNSQAHRELPGKFELSNLSRDRLSREIGRRVTQTQI